MKHKFLYTVISFLLVLFPCIFLHAQDAVSLETPSIENITTLIPDVRFTADARISHEALSDTTIDAESFLYAALVASGANDNEINKFLEQIHDIYDQCKSMISAEALSNGDKAEQTLHFLYTSVLSTYEENQTRVDVALSNGIYNCVSSAVIFMYMMKKENIPVTAIETPTHAFCTVLVDGVQIDVETTNPWGYNPGVKKQIASDALSGKKYVSVPAKKYANRHAVSDQRIISLIYLNRMASLQKQHKDNETIGLALDALVLQNNSDSAMNDLRQSFYNTAVDLSLQKEHEKGILLIQYARGMYGDSKLFQPYLNAAVKSICNAYTIKKDFKEAVSCVQKYKNVVDDITYTDLFDAAEYNLLLNSIRNLSFTEALTQIHENQNALAKETYTKLVSFAYSHEASNIAETKDWLAATALLDEGLVEIPKDTTLAQQRNSYRQNYAIEIHNRATDLYNKGDVAGALTVVQDGLQIISDSSILKNDLKILQ